MSRPRRTASATEEQSSWSIISRRLIDAGQAVVLDDRSVDVLPRATADLDTPALVRVHSAGTNPEWTGAEVGYTPSSRLKTDIDRTVDGIRRLAGLLPVAPRRSSGTE